MKQKKSSPFQWVSVETSDALAHDEDGTLLSVIQTIDEKKDWSGLKKDVYATFYLKKSARALERKKETKLTVENMRTWSKSSAFKKTVYEVEKNYEEKFTMTGLMIIMTGTMVLFFLRAVLAQTYFINFSVDAIVGAIGAVILFSNFRVKYRMIRSCTNSKDFLYMDISSFVLSALLKMMLPPNIDFTLVVLIVAYFIEKRKFKFVLDEFLRSY
ncbi:hypothetical protein [uncultured Dubosiella sp.]|uniref:hypothetical protein n=3 Tax=uncultured Dubosiella sp. TaxID=1937011 RepID=UPI0025B1C9DD|nr:hypothetical protein [uncultured Dubosiella sp.]